MPATIVRSPGTVVEGWVNWLDDVELERMHQTEGVGALYSFGVLSPSRLLSEIPLSGPPHVYVDCYGAWTGGSAPRALPRDDPVAASVPHRARCP